MKNTETYKLNNTNDIDIYTTYQLCKSGNNNAISNLFTEALNDEISFKTSDVGLAKMINKCYKDMTTPVKYAKEDPNHWTKYSASTFTGSKEDLTCIFANETFKLFNNPDFTPISETDIYDALKVNVDIEVNKELRTKDTFKETYSTVISDDITFDDDDGEFSPELYDDYALQDWLDSQNTDNNPYYAVETKVSGKAPKEKIEPTYTYFMRESAKFVKNNLKNALRNDATAKKNLIDLIKEVYDYRTDKKGKIKWMTQKSVEYIYKQKYGKSTDMSNDLNAFFEILASRLLGYVPSTRDKFKSEKIKYVEGHEYTEEECAAIQKQLLTTAYNCHVMLSAKSSNYIDGVISEKIKDVDRGLYNYYYNNMLHSLKMAIVDFEKQGYSLDFYEILYYINHQYDDPEDDEKPKKKKELYWNLNTTGDKTTIDYYRHHKDNAFNIQTNRQKVLPCVPEIYIFGNCIVLIVTTTKDIFYYAADRRLPYVVRRGSKYYSY